MRVNEFDIPSVSDTAPSAVRKLEKATVKPSLKSILDQIQPPSAQYSPIMHENRSSAPNLPSNQSFKAPLDFFKLFITSSMISTISEHTNINAEDTEITGKHRVWIPTTPTDIEVFIGILLSMGLIRLHRTESYWDIHSDLHGDPEISQHMALKRWQQIKRFFKLSNPRVEPDSIVHWTCKLEPISTLFQQNCQRYIRPARDVVVDEQLILFKGRSRHTMTIHSKAAGKGFKIYCLCSNNYLFAFMYASKPSKIVGLQLTKNLSDSASVVMQLVKQLPQPYEYVVYLDNFFSSVKLFSCLKEMQIGAVGTSKRGSGFDEDLLKLKAIATKEKHWGTCAVTTVKDEVVCMAWQDNNTVLLMTTAHSIADATKEFPRNARSRHQILKNSFKTGQNDTEFLPFPGAILDYNANMGGCDGNAQQRANYSPAERKSYRYWWSLWIFILKGAVLNAYILYKLTFPDSTTTHDQFQKLIAIALVRNPAGSTRLNPHDFNNNNPWIPPPEHQWKKLSKRAYCTPCRINGTKPATVSSMRRRRPLEEVDSNSIPIHNKRQKRTKQSIYGCTSKACEGLAACKTAECWEALHA